MFDVSETETERCEERELARYNLIISDKTFGRMLAYGARHGKTVGKLLNEVLNAYNWEEIEVVAAAKIEVQNPCSICGHSSTMTLKHQKGMLKLFCAACGQNALESHKWKTI